MDPPYVKNYDDEEDPQRWQKWNLSSWGFLAVFVGAQRVGAAVVAYDTPELNFLQNRTDLAALLDIRVAPDYRGKGIGRLLFRSVEEWARSRGCELLKIETQNINVPACKFYVTQGCQLGMFDKHAYKEYPEEVQLVWYKDL